MLRQGEATRVLVCVDLQGKFVAHTRLAQTERDETLANCGELLALWRRDLRPVMHLKRIARPDWFDPDTRSPDWIPELRPRPGEMIFEHPLPSAYSSARFADYMSSMRDVRCVMVGFSLDEAMLATAVEGFHRSHRYELVGDAAACVPREGAEAASYRRAVLEITSRFATVRPILDYRTQQGSSALNFSSRRGPPP
jgi:nicotinamidase-related amidase